MTLLGDLMPVVAQVVKDLEMATTIKVYKASKTSTRGKEFDAAVEVDAVVSSSAKQIVATGESYPIYGTKVTIIDPPIDITTDDIIETPSGDQAVITTVGQTEDASGTLVLTLILGDRARFRYGANQLHRG